MTDSIPQQAGPGAGADEREAFEAWCRAEFGEPDLWIPGNPKCGYASSRVMDYWTGWQARASLSHLAAPLAVEDSRERCASSPVVTYEKWRETAPWYQVMKPDPDEDRNSEAATIYRLANIAASQAWAAAMAAASSGKEKME